MPDSRLRVLLNGFQVSEALHAAAELGVPDAFARGSLSLEALASATGTLSDPLGRLMRVLSDLDVVARDADGRYRLTAMGERMRPDVEGNWNAWTRTIGSPAIRQSWSRLSDAIRTGKTGFELAHGSGIWAYRAQHPEEGERFDSAMRSGTERLAEPVSRCLGNLDGAHIVDVGGGDGSLLAHLLRKHPASTGSLLEHGEAAQRASESLSRQGLQDRVRVIEGDFFKAVPPEGDLYMLKFVLHDWDDDRALRILRSCRAAVQTRGGAASLVVIERLLDAAVGAREASLADLNMLVNTGGRERTRQEYERLLECTGFGLSRCEAVSGSLTVMRAEPR